MTNSKDEIKMILTKITKIFFHLPSGTFCRDTNKLKNDPPSFQSTAWEFKAAYNVLCAARDLLRQAL